MSFKSLEDFNFQLQDLESQYELRYLLDIATTWNKEEHGERIDILDAFKRRTSARIEVSFNSQLEEDIEVHMDSHDHEIEN